jgi:hypothetical protein
VAGEKREQPLLDVDLREGGRPDAVDEPRPAVSRAVPIVHGIEDPVRLVHDQHRSLGDRGEPGVGHDDGDLEDPVAVRIEAGHLHVEPDEMIRVLRHRF